MRGLKINGWQERSFTGLHAVFALIAIFSQLFFLISPTHAQPISAVYLWPAAIALLALILYRTRSLQPGGMSILLALTAWTYGTCLLNGDYYLVYHIGFMLGVVLAFGVCYPLFLLMDEKQRSLWLRRSANAIVWVLSLVAWLGVYTAATGTPIVTPLSRDGLGMYTLERRLYLFGQHPNSNACIFSIALFLALFLMARARSRKRILYVPACIGLYAAIALTLSRTVMITVSIGFAMLTLLLLIRRSTLPKTALRAGTYIVAPLAVAVAAFLCFAPVYHGIISLPAGDGASAVLPLAKAESSPPDTALPESEQAASASGDIPERTFSNDFGTLRGRTDIWKAGIDQIKQRPIILLIGMLDSEVARLPNALGRGPLYHMHNMLLEVLMLTGIPGLLLFLVFVGKLVANSVRLFFNQDAPLSIRVLTIPIVMLLLNGITEAYPSLGGRMVELLFFTLAGAVMACASFYKRGENQENLPEAL